MQKTILKLKKIEMKDFRPNESKAVINIFFDKNDKEEAVTKEFVLKDPLDVINKILLMMKSYGKIIVEEEDDDILKNIYITRVADEEEIEEKLFSWIRSLNEKIKTLKTTKNAQQYMRLFNEIKIMKLEF